MDSISMFGVDRLKSSDKQSKSRLEFTYKRRLKPFIWIRQLRILKVNQILSTDT